MELAECLIGTPVRVAAADDFYQFIDGWRGTVADHYGGRAWIECLNPDGHLVRFLVPPEQLRKDTQ